MDADSTAASATLIPETCPFTLPFSAASFSLSSLPPLAPLVENQISGEQDAQKTSGSEEDHGTRDDERVGWNNTGRQDGDDQA